MDVGWWLMVTYLLIGWRHYDVIIGWRHKTTSGGAKLPFYLLLTMVHSLYIEQPWTTPTPGFKVTLFLTLNISETVRYRHSFNAILIGTYTRPTQQCRFEWSWVTLSDSAKYSITRSVARSFCDSWASCSIVLMCGRFSCSRSVRYYIAYISFIHSFIHSC